jgi:hypothetical protein
VKKIFILLGLFLLTPKGYAHEEEEVSANIGAGNAVTEADHEKGFKLSEQARKTLDYKESLFSGHVPPSSVVRYQDKTGVYRVRDGWIKLVGPDELKKGDRVVTGGVALLRVTELDTFTAEEEEHAH